MVRAISTTRNANKWHKRKPELSYEGADTNKLLEDMTEIAKLELENTNATIVLV